MQIFLALYLVNTGNEKNNNPGLELVNSAFNCQFKRNHILNTRLKVSKFRNVFLVSSILQKKIDFTTMVTQVELFSLFFGGRIEDTKKKFRI